jgi:hypothetical protein
MVAGLCLQVSGGRGTGRSRARVSIIEYALGLAPARAPAKPSCNQNAADARRSASESELMVAGLCLQVSGGRGTGRSRARRVTHTESERDRAKAWEHAAAAALTRFTHHARASAIARNMRWRVPTEKLLTSSTEQGLRMLATPHHRLHHTLATCARTLPALSAGVEAVSSASMVLEQPKLSSKRRVGAAASLACLRIGSHGWPTAVGSTMGRLRTLSSDAVMGPSLFQTGFVHFTVLFRLLPGAAATPVSLDVYGSPSAELLDVQPMVVWESSSRWLRGERGPRGPRIHRTSDWPGPCRR